MINAGVSTGIECVIKCATGVSVSVSKVLPLNSFPYIYLHFDSLCQNFVINIYLSYLTRKILIYTKERRYINASLTIPL